MVFIDYVLQGDTHPTTAYAIAVTSNALNCKIGDWEKLACERHLHDLKRQNTESFPYIFDETRANRIFDWYQKVCRHVEGVFAGEYFKLLPHQFFDFGSIYGWVHKDTGYRRFNKVYKKVGRGNAKSAESSALCNYHMCADYFYPPYHPELGRKSGNPQVECAAVDRKQAGIVYEKAKMMADNSPEISKRLIVKRTYVEHKEDVGHMRALSKDTKNKNGLNPDLVIVDEWHEHPTRFIVDTCLSAFGKKPQNLMVIITTAGVDAENNVCKIEEESICKPILQSIIEDESYFVIIREVDEKDDPSDFSNLTKSNPMFQVDNEYSRILKGLVEKEHKLAFDSGIPEKIREYKTKRLNWWVEDSDEKYFDSDLMNQFKSLAVPHDEFKRLIKGTQSWNGGDLSKCDDLTASAFVHDIGGGRIAISSMGFIPDGAISRHEKSDRVPYRSWCDDGYCTKTDGEVTDIIHLENWIVGYHKQNELRCQETANDSYNALQYMNNMAARGYTPIEVRQGKYSLSEATKLFRNLVREGKIIHDGNKCFQWCLSNAYFEQDSNENIKLSKKHAKDTQRIDLVAAVINALTRYIAHQSKPSVYESRGVLSV